MTLTDHERKTEQPRSAPERAKTKVPKHPPINRVAIWGPLLVVLLLAIGLIFGIWRHIQQKREQRETAAKNAQVVVEFETVARNTKPRDLILPGNITAVRETTIFARATGYVARWLVDIGDNVTEGQILAELATPELDQQLAQARQQESQAKANFELARVSAQRWRELVSKQVVSKQENDERQGAYEASSAAVQAAAANTRTLEQLQGFQKVTAPFAGKITARKVDVGALVAAGSGTTGTALFTLSQTDPLYIYVNVPQNDVASVRVGLETQLLVSEYPDRKFTAKVTRTAGALDPTSRTMLVQLEAPNADSALYPGMYAQAKFSLPPVNAPLLVPANAFLFKTEGAQVASLTPENKVHWRNIVIARDLGHELEVASGLENDDRVILNPTDDLREGLAVQAKPAEAAPEDGQPKK